MYELVNADMYCNGFEVVSTLEKDKTAHCYLRAISILQSNSRKQITVFSKLQFLEISHFLKKHVFYNPKIEQGFVRRTHQTLSSHF